MYDRVTIKDGVEAVQQYHAMFDIQSSVDGVVFASPDANSYFSSVYIPDTLRDWLRDIRLLKHMPIAYFVPDAALLPPESIRFFHIDPSWMDRVVDGVFSAANTGTVDSMFSASLLAMTRESIDQDLVDLAETTAPGSGWTPDQGMTGLLIRSELARRWPDLIVRAFKTDPDNSSAGPPLPLLRAEPISKDIYIAIFGGTPTVVHVREPNVGVRFGVEEDPPGSTVWKVDPRNADGSPAAGPSLTVLAKSPPNRTLNITNLAGQVGNAPRRVALALEQRPYVQEFKSTVAEPTGSVPLSNFINLDGTLMTFNLRNGRVLNLANLQARQAQLDEMYPKEKP
jgi:hypothetical protein